MVIWGQYFGISHLWSIAVQLLVQVAYICAWAHFSQTVTSETPLLNNNSHHPRPRTRRWQGDTRECRAGRDPPPPGPCPRPMGWWRGASWPRYSISETMNDSVKYVNYNQLFTRHHPKSFASSLHRFLPTKCKNVQTYIFTTKQGCITAENAQNIHGKHSVQHSVWSEQLSARWLAHN